MQHGSIVSTKWMVSWLVLYRLTSWSRGGLLLGRFAAMCEVTGLETLNRSASAAALSNELMVKGAGNEE